MESPGFFDASKVGEVWVERGALVAEAAAHAKKRVRPSREDKARVVAFGIDCQIGFCTPGSSLFVPGAVEDTRRTIEFLYDNLASISKLVFSLDTHSIHQVFHPAFWVDERGNAPAPFSTISSHDVEKGLFRPASGDVRSALEYTRALEQRGKYRLTIWPYHALLGGVSHALVPALMEAAMFHSLVRESPTSFETKGEHPLTENYSVLSPEVTELAGARVGAFNDALFSELASYDKIYVFGQAKSHCVLSTLNDLADHLERVDQGGSKLISRVHVLTDAMSPVSPPPLDPLPNELNFPVIADRAFDALARRGMKMVTTKDPA